MGFSFNKGLKEEEKEKLIDNKEFLKEHDGSPLVIDKNGRSRMIVAICKECDKVRKIRLVDFLNMKYGVCNSCSKKGSRNVSKRKDVREKLSRKGVKDTSYLTKEWKKKFSESRKGEKNPHYGDIESNETKRKKRIAAIKNIKKRIKNGGQLTPAYNINGCRLIEQYSKVNGHNFQHAENGGEYHIKELGYWVDGYDKEKNIVIEIDESNHYDALGNLKERDLIRQKEIEKFLDCKFIRLKI